MTADQWTEESMVTGEGSGIKVMRCSAVLSLSAGRFVVRALTQKHATVSTPHEQTLLISLRKKRMESTRLSFLDRDAQTERSHWPEIPKNFEIHTFHLVLLYDPLFCYFLAGNDYRSFLFPSKSFLI